MTLLCPHCFHDTGLQRRLVEIRPAYDEGQCSFHPRRKGIPVEGVAAIVDEVFRNNFEFGDADPVFSDDPEEPEVWYQQKGDRLTDVVDGLTGPENEDILEAVCSQLILDDSYWPGDGEEPFYDEEYRYERIAHGDGANGRLWQRFCTGVLHEQRFFNDEAREALRDIFRNIHLLRDTQRNCPVYMLHPGESPVIWRARIIDGEEQKKILADPVGRMGAAPPRVGHANRMNVAGVQAFYGSFDLPTCLSELRPTVGDLVVAAQFRIRRSLCVLDTTRFAAPPKELNLFAKDHARRLTQWRFMQRFMTEIARPILPTDEHLDYVPTQVVAEYLNNEHLVRMDGEQCHLDAIIYASAQRPAGKNFVFLGEAAITEPIAPLSTDSPPTSAAPSLGRLIMSRPARPNAGLDLVDGSLEIVTIRSADFGHSTDRLRDAVAPPF